MENKVPLDIERTLAENTERSLAEDTELSLDEDTQPSLERENERLRQRVSQLELELLAAQPDEQRALLSAVIETSVVAICLLDTDGKIVFANAAAESILDLERSLIVQRRYDDPEWRRTALDGSLWSDDQHPFARVMATGEPVRDVRFALEWPSGQRKFVSVDGAPIRDAEGSITSVVCCVSNITEEVRNTERMRARREWLRLALSSARMGIWSWDVVRDDVRWSDEVSVLFGLEPGEFAGTYEAYLRCVHPEDRECVRDSVAAVREPDAVTYFVEHRVVWPSGDVRWIEGRGRFIRDEDGSILTVTGTVADISARKEAEQALRASQDQLRQAQRLESIGRLAGGAAHDFNNLLTVVHGCAELIAATVDDHPNCRELTNSIVAAAEQGSALTQQLLAFAREQSIEPRVVDINDQIRKSSTLLRRLIGVGVELRMCLASRAISVEIDPRQFDQVLINLVVNACDAMNGIGVLSISTHSEPSRSSNVERAVITVDDSGTGIDPEVLPFLFEPFFTTKAPGEGRVSGCRLVSASSRRPEVRSA